VHRRIIARRIDCRAEWYAEDQYREALARLHQLAAGRRSAVGERCLAPRSALHRRGAAQRRARAADTTNERFSDDFVGSITRRCYRRCGRAELLRMLRETFAVFSRRRWRPLLPVATGRVVVLRWRRMTDSRSSAQPV
jgi:hypothetical protein